MSLQTPGVNTSALEVTNIDTKGFWLFLDGNEHFLSFDEFPWFVNATISQITKVVEQSKDHLYWPELDIDLTVDMIDNPGKYPLKYK